MRHFETLNREDRRQHDKLKRLCNPLRTHLGIDAFTYGYVQTDGSFINVNASPDISESHFSGENYKLIGVLAEPEKVTPGVVFLDHDPHYRRLMEACKDRVTTIHPACILWKDEDKALHYAWFASTKKHDQLPQLYANHMPFLHKFARYFVQEAQDLIRSYLLESVNLREIMGAQAFGVREYKMTNPLSTDCVESFLQSIGESRFVLQAGRQLSRRERQVARALLDYQTAAEIAATLQLSKRTVEHYIDNLKNRLSVYSKKQLIQACQLLDLAGMLI